MSASDNFATFAPSNDTIIDRPNPYFRDFGGFWASESKYSAVTHDTLVYSNGRVEIQINGTELSDVLDGQVP